MTTTHRIGTTAVLILSLVAASASAASAASYSRQDKSIVPAVNLPSAAVYSRQDKSIVPATSPSTTAGSTAKVSAAPPVVRIQAPTSGFHWGDAGIGAAGGFALSMIGLGAALAVSQHRIRRDRQTTSLS
ncbi:MAG: hypothetical protein ACXVFQ_19045 [Solirubrobacteraceae bacterium]